jgi:hypothetical protein
MEKLNALTLALRQNAQGEADLGGLNEDYARAENMRNTSNAKVNQYGTVSPFAVMADVINQSRGRKDMREIAPQRTAARSAVGNNANAFKLYQAREADAKNTRDQTNLETDKATALKLSTAKEAQRVEKLRLEKERYATQEGQDQTALELEASIREGEQNKMLSGATNWTNDITGEKLKTFRTANGLVDSEGNPVTSLKGFSEDAKETKDILEYGYGTAPDKEADKSFKIMALADRVGTKANALPDSAKAELNSGAVRFGQWFLDAATPQGLGALIKSQYSGYSAEAKDFLVSLSRMSATERHELFGAALTEGEERSGEEFLAFVNGLNLDQIMSRARDTFESNGAILTAQDRSRNGTKRAESVANQNWTAFSPALQLAIPPPSGVDASEWGQYSPAQQAAYVKKYGGG